MINLVKPRINSSASIDYRMTLSLNCKDAGDPVCTHTMTGETEEELLANAKKHGMEVHGYTEETWNEEISKKKDHFKSLIKKTYAYNLYFRSQPQETQQGF
jgi:predicted small metal-binding protein